MNEEKTVNAEPTGAVVVTPQPQQNAHWLSVIDKMIDKNVNADLLSKVFEMQMAWEKEQQRQAFVSAFVAFKAEAPAYVKRTGAVGYEARDGKKVGYRHVELDVVCAELVPILSKYDLAHSWETKQEADGWIVVTCKVEHSAGYFKTVTLRAMPDTSGAKNAIQAVGSAVYYLQRYTLMAALGMSQGEGADDDGQATSLITGDQMAEINTLLETSTLTLKGVLKWLQIESLDAMKASDFVKCITELKRKQKATDPAMLELLRDWQESLNKMPSVDDVNKNFLPEVKKIKTNEGRLAVFKLIASHFEKLGFVFDETLKKFVLEGANP